MASLFANEKEMAQCYHSAREKIRDEINRNSLAKYYDLEKSADNLFVCPICGSGKHSNRTGALSLCCKKNGKWHATCFSASHCFDHGGKIGEDTLGALKILWDTNEDGVFEKLGYSLKEEAAKEAKGEAHEPTRNQREIKNNTSIEEKKKAAEIIKAQRKRAKEEVRTHIEKLPGSPGEKYLLSRGISLQTMKRFDIGYSERESSVIIPYNKNWSYYVKRNIFIQGHAGYKNMPTEIGGKVPLFNPAALYTNDGTCFITESVLCAISIIQAGGAAVALSGLSDQKLIDQLNKTPTPAIIILCLDNDKPGKEETERVIKKLEEMNVSFYNGTPGIMSSGEKDPNEVLQKHGTEILKQRIRETEEEARKHTKKEQKQPQ